MVLFRISTGIYRPPPPVKISRAIQGPLQALIIFAYKVHMLGSVQSFISLHHVHVMVYDVLCRNMQPTKPENVGGAPYTSLNVLGSFYTQDL